MKNGASSGEKPAPQNEENEEMRHAQDSEEEQCPQPEDDVEEILEHDLHSFTTLGTSLAACPMLPEKLRAKIGEAVRAAKGCTVCKMPLGALHALNCEVTRYEWRHHGLRREVMSFDTSVYGPHEEQPASKEPF